jgi:hypothetical protein
LSELRGCRLSKISKILGFLECKGHRWDVIFVIRRPCTRRRNTTRRSWDVGVGNVGPHLGHERPDRSGTTTVTSGPSSAQLSNRTRPSITGHPCLLGLSDTEVITPPGLTFDAVGCPIERAVARRFRLWSRRSWQLRLDSRRAATVVCTDRGARMETVEDHDRQTCHRRPLTWRFSPVFPGPQRHAVP